ncbi:MAG TPA: hypothetical protein VHM25_24600 [Polyangiaceae bacterium]|jgi:hypothetical protein|nr:hypothetical protein [Polyangiaceae bacterium]
MSNERALRALSPELRALKAKVALDSAEFRREVGFRLPAALESVSASEIRQHLGPFLEHTFRDWAERENREVQQALVALSRREPPSNASPIADAEELTGPDSRLMRPSFEVSTFALDASVVAALALGVGTLFANAAVGGLFLLAAPTLAAFGRERGDRALRKRAAESAMVALDQAISHLSAELDRVIDDFAR